MKNFCAYKVNSVGDLGWRESLTLISAGKNANDHSSVNHFATTIYQFITLKVLALTIFPLEEGLRSD